MRKQRCANHTRGVPRPESDPSEIWNGRSTVGFCLLMGVCVPSLCTVQYSNNLPTGGTCDFYRGGHDSSFGVLL